MRFRLYEIGSGQIGAVLQCDQFPVELGVEEASGALQLTSPATSACCRLDEDHGQILFEGLDEGSPVLVNDAPLSRGPLTPGDQLSVDGHRYVVSYEQFGEASESESRFRLSPGRPTFA